MRGTGFRKLAALVAATGLLALGGAAQAADSLLTWDGLKPLKLFHAYSASDGLSYIEEIQIPGQLGASATPGALVYLNAKPDQLKIGRAQVAEMSGWHYAGDSRHVIIVLQGALGFDIGDGKTHTLKPGEAILAEDWTGKGHRSGCVASDKDYCMVVDILLDRNPKALPLAPPPGK